MKVKILKSIGISVASGVATSVIAKQIIDRIEMIKMKKNDPEGYKYAKAAKKTSKAANAKIIKINK